jgi:hypothetical protein
VEVVEGEEGRVQWILLKLWGDACECRFLTQTSFMSPPVISHS